MSLTAHRAAFRALTALGLVPALLLGTLLVSPPAQAQRIKPVFFGMHDSRVASGSLTELPIGSIRLWDTGTAWRQIETAPGVFDFTAVDRAVETARLRRVRPMIVLGQTPRFHAQRPNAPGAYGPGATSMPKNLFVWKRYVGKVARRYGNAVDYQIWNEPNVTNYWTGNVGQMAQLTATASTVIRRAAGISARVVAPSFPLRLIGQQRWYRTYWSSRVGGKSVASFVNVVSVNLYPAADKAPEASMPLLRFAKSALPLAARRKPMWNTEINYGLLGGATPPEISPAKQAAYVARTLVLNAASPIGRVYWYRWDLGPYANTHLAEADRTTPTRAGRAWGVARGWIVGTNVTGCVVTSTGRLKGLYTCTALRGSDEVRRIYWKPAGTAVRIITHRTTRQWSDLAGIPVARTGSFGLWVGQAPVVVVSRR